MPVPAGGSETFAVGSPYATVDDIKAYLGIDPDDTKDDVQIGDALTSVSQEIEDVCGRQFNRDESASTRLFEPASAYVVFTDDFYALDDLAVVVDDTSWATTDYTLLPLNGLVRGRPWPYNRIEGSTYRMPLCRQSVAVTARWGWLEVPAPVRQACKIAAAETFSLKDARFGVAGFGQYGDIRVRQNPMVMAKLAPYVRDPVKVA